jgi:hypothetical protein
MQQSTRFAHRRWTALATAVAFSAFSVSLTGLGLDPVEAAPPEAEKRVALFVFPKGRFAAAEALLLENLLRSQLQQLQRVRPAGPGGEPDRSLESLVAASLENGFRALNERKAAVALEHFERAHQYATAYEGPVAKRLMARITKGYGAARVMLGDVGPGQTLIESSLNLIPDQQISEYGWTLDLRSAFNEVAERRAGAETGTLDIDVVPEGAVVRVDGELKGFAPLQVPGLAPGRHWVEAGADGYKWQGMFVEVPAGDSAIHAVELLPAKNQTAINNARANLEKAVGKAAPGTALDEALAALNSTAVIALEVSSANNAYVFSGWLKDGNGAARKLQVQFARDGSFVGRAKTYLAEILGVQPNEDDSMLALDGPPQASVMAAGDLVIDPDDPIFKSDGGKSKDSVTDEWWFWVIVGGVTAGLVAGGVVLFSGAGDGSGPVGRVNVNVNALR